MLSYNDSQYLYRSIAELRSVMFWETPGQPLAALLREPLALSVACGGRVQINSAIENALQKLFVNHQRVCWCLLELWLGQH